MEKFVCVIWVMGFLVCLFMSNLNGCIFVIGGVGFIGSVLVYVFNQCGFIDIVVIDFFGQDEKWKNLVLFKFVDYVEVGSFCQ